MQVRRFNPGEVGRKVSVLVPCPETIVAPPATAQRKVRSLPWAAGTEAVTLVALAAMVAGLVTRPAVSAAMTVTLAVGEKEVPSAPMVAARVTVPGVSATNVTVAVRGSPTMRPPEMLHW